MNRPAGKRRNAGEARDARSGAAGHGPAAERGFLPLGSGVFSLFHGQERVVPAILGRMRRERVEYIGGPLDGKIVELGPDEDVTVGAYLTIPGHTQRAVYEPVPGDIVYRWHFLGWIDR